MANTQRISTQEAIEYLSRDGGRVPCSRYGWDGASCAPVAVLVAEIVARETGEELDEERLDHAMGLVVNDHDDPAYLIHEYADHDERAYVQSYDWEDNEDWS